MDILDLQIIKILLRNCRTTYRKIAEILNLSVNAIYKRIQNMVDNGSIVAFTAQPSVVALNGIQALVCGSSKSKNLNIVSTELGEHECIYFVGNAGGNYLYIDAYLKNISELHDYISFASNTGKLENYESYIMKLPYRISSENLTRLDYKILRTLRSDARRSVADLAEDVDVSAKTARKRIKRMMEYNLVDFSIYFAPHAEGIIVCQFHLYIGEGIDFTEEYNRINGKYTENILYLRQFSNVPNLLMMTALTKSNLEASDLYTKLQNESFKEIEHRIIYNGFFFETWKDRLFKDMISEK